MIKIRQIILAFLLVATPFQAFAWRNDRNVSDETKLSVAVLRGNLEDVKLLILKGAVDVNTKDKLGSTALINASSEGHLEIVKFLVSKGADLNIKNKYGYTALMKAANEGHLEVVKFLVKSGADVNIKDKSGDTALHNAIDLFMETLKVSTYKGKETKSATLNEAIKKHTDIAKFLIDNGADVNAKNDNGDTVLIKASNSGNLDIVKYLVKNGTDVNAKNNQNKTALNYSKTADVAEFLSEKMGK